MVLEIIFNQPICYLGLLESGFMGCPLSRRDPLRKTRHPLEYECNRNLPWSGTPAILTPGLRKLRDLSGPNQIRFQDPRNIETRTRLEGFQII